MNDEIKNQNLKRLGLTSKQIDDEIARSKYNILKHMDTIAQIFVDMGYADSKEDVKLTIGPELECTEIAGLDSFIQRNTQIAQEVDEAIKRGDPHPSFNINDKKGAYMPPHAQVPALDKKYATVEALGPHIKRTHVEPEPTFGTNTFDDTRMRKINGTLTMLPDLVAASQIEFSAPPHSPIGATEWLNKTMNSVVHGATSAGLKRIDFRAVPHHSTAPNSIHLNSVITVKGKNAFSKAEWENDPTQYGKPSKLLFYVGVAHKDYLKHSLFLFARSKNDYERFSSKEVSAPSYIGITQRKEHGNFATAMFRGEGRKTERLNSANPDRPDDGPMRFEFRAPCTGAAGHPNKDAYPEQRILPYQLMEAYLHMLEQGVRLWQIRCEEEKRLGHDIPVREDSLDPLTARLADPIFSELPDNREVALKRFLEDKTVQEYWGDRVKNMVLLSDRVDQINAADEHPSAQIRGPHVERLLTKVKKTLAEKNIYGAYE